MCVEHAVWYLDFVQVFLLHICFKNYFYFYGKLTFISKYLHYNFSKRDFSLMIDLLIIIFLNIVYNLVKYI